MKVAAIILVGGEGTRLRPLTLTQPKALLPVLNRPFLSYQFELLRKAGVRDVILAASPWFRRWQRDLQRIVPKGMRLYFAFEPKPLGTGGAIRYGFEALKKSVSTSWESIFVLNGDILVDVDLKKLATFHKKTGSACTLALRQVPDPSRFGLVKFKASGQVTAFVEKPQKHRGRACINAGIYCSNSSFIESIPMGRVSSVERDIFPARLEQGFPLYALLTKGYWNDIGTPASYLQAHIDLATKDSNWRSSGLLTKETGPSLPRSVSIHGMVSMERGVRVGPNSRLENVILMKGTHFEEGVEAFNAIVGRNCRIGAFSKLGDGTVLGDNSKLPPHSKT